jgi:hypothetical protein
MPPKANPIDKATTQSTQVDWATEVDELYRTLKRDYGVVDVKFAFGPLVGKDPQEIYRAVAAALRAVMENKTKDFGGLNDSYGLKPL